MTETRKRTIKVEIEIETETEFEDGEQVSPESAYILSVVANGEKIKRSGSDPMFWTIWDNQSGSNIVLEQGDY